tara:strand:+ start:323 stop:535 length:213 start_codon:yes stop_codon:yes gene_type:complete
MTKQYGIITLYVIATVALLIVACAKQDTISIPEQREPIHFPDLDIEGMPEIDTAQGDEAVEGDLLDGDEQ